MAYVIIMMLVVFVLYFYWSVKRTRALNASIQEESIKPNRVQDTTSIIDVMEEQKFWNIIDNSRKIAGGNYEKQCQVLTQLLQAEQTTELIKFSNSFSTFQNEAYQWKLWAAAYMINGGCSDDCFYDFRSWLIGQGKSAYNNALKDPETLLQLDVDPDNWEGLQYAAMNAYQSKTGKELPVATLNLKQKPSGEPWNEDPTALKKLLPKLYEKYGS